MDILAKLHGNISHIIILRPFIVFETKLSWSLKNVCVKPLLRRIVGDIFYAL